MSGFLITCTLNKERSSAREMCDLLLEVNILIKKNKLKVFNV